MYYATRWSLFGIPSEGKGELAVFGIAYDSSSELGKGTLAFPIAVRLASYGIEWEELRNMKFLNVHDAKAVDFGDVLPSIEPEKMIDEVLEFLDDLWAEGFRKFLMLGGNHIVTYPVVKFLVEKGKIKEYVQFDAHLDYRDEHTGTKYSFACVARRIRELGVNVTLIGPRSFSVEEKDALEEVKIIDGREVDAKIKEVVKAVKDADYVSIDMDVLENARVTNPEPHNGMKLGTLLDIIEKYNGNYMDIVEGLPSTFFSDPTATAGALLARKFLINKALL